MCGIVAIVAKAKAGFFFKHKKMFEEMLFIDTLRGEDSTGIYSINKYGNVNWAKEASTAEVFLQEKGSENILKDMVWDSVAMVGHNRKATKGTIKDENAHPFVEEDIILVHNGTLLNHKDLNDSVEVDSHAIAHAIKEHGVVKAISKIEGAFAVISYDVTNRKLHAFRNAERPLWICDMEDCWAIASEPWIIYGPAWRNELKSTKMKEIPAATLLSFDLEDFSLSEKEVKLYEKKPLAVVKAFPTVVNSDPKRQGTVSKFINDYKKGELVVFSPDKMETHDTFWRIEGTHYNSKVRVVAECSVISYEAATVSNLMNQDHLVAEITGISYNSVTSSGTVFCEEPTQSDIRFSINGEQINEEVVQRLSGECYACKETIDEDELELSYLRINRNNGKIIHICPACVDVRLAKNAQWGGIKAYETSVATLQ